MRRPDKRRRAARRTDNLAIVELASLELASLELASLEMAGFETWATSSDGWTARPVCPLGARSFNPASEIRSRPSHLDPALELAVLELAAALEIGLVAMLGAEVVLLEQPGRALDAEVLLL